MTVRVGLASGGDIKTILCAERATTQEALAAAGIEPRLGDQLLVNGKTVLGNHPLREADLVLVSQPIEGG